VERCGRGLEEILLCTLHYLFSPSNILRVKKSRWTRHVICTGERKGSYTFLVGNLEGKRTLTRLRPRRKDNIKIDLQETRRGRELG
jgi:hypothetical protein